MPDINDNDSDDLFRRAAENYPLRTNSSDWDKVSRKLDEDESDKTFIIPPVYSGKEKNKRRRILLLLLLLPLMGIGYYLYNSHSSSLIKNIAQTPANTGENSVVQKRETKDKAAINKENIISNNDNNTKNKSAGINNSVDKKDAGAKTKNQNIQTTKNTVKEEDVADAKKLNKNSLNNNTLTTNIDDDKIKNTTNNKSSNKIFINKNKKNKIVFEKIFEKNYTSSVENKNSLNIIINNDEAANAAPQSISVFNINSLAYSNFSSPDINGRNINNTVASFIKTDSSSVNNKKKNAGKKESSFYAAILIAPDLSTVKFQSVKGTGYTAGILFGYNISKKIAIETGAYYDYKKYYTEGEYFHSAFASYVDLINVNGGCRMIEIPVNVRYNFINNEKIKWFATTGLSNYFMFKEGYNYNFLYNGMQEQKYYTYKNGSQNWFSVINISAGYEHKLGNAGNLRLEPYLRIPLTGMGTGNLPVMSMGFNVGITHSFK